jgi:hypothetical protein
MFASYWPLVADDGVLNGEVASAAWTVVMRGGSQNASDPKTLTNVPPPPPGVTWNYYDLWAGKQLASADAALTVETDGYGCMLATPNTTENDPVSKNGFFAPFLYLKTEHFTKTGSGQT